MSETFFVSDTHFAHENILKYEAIARPFATVEEMNEVIIDKWNNVVGKYDKIYHLGDFAFGKSNIQIAHRLKGQKRLIMGNHDCYPTTEYLKYFKSIHGVLFWRQCILTHVPVHPNQLLNRFRLNCHGHLHSKNVPDKRYFNCSIEQNNLAPISADIIFQHLKDFET